jgi:cytochrome c-type biogenesis protein CcmH/NrfF
MTRRRLHTAWAALLIAGLAFGADIREAERAQALARELRCPVCQNQNLADSNAPLAVDLRNEIARQVAAGRSDNEVRSFMVQRYGDYVLYDPPMGLHTALLWAAPGLLLGLFAAMAIRGHARQRGRPATGGR